MESKEAGMLLSAETPRYRSADGGVLGSSSIEGVISGSGFSALGEWALEPYN